MRVEIIGINKDGKPRKRMLRNMSMYEVYMYDDAGKYRVVKGVDGLLITRNPQLRKTFQLRKYSSEEFRKDALKILDGKVERLVKILKGD